MPITPLEKPHCASYISSAQAFMLMQLCGNNSQKLADHHTAVLVSRHDWSKLIHADMIEKPPWFKQKNATARIPGNPGYQTMQCFFSNRKSFPRLSKHPKSAQFASPKRLRATSICDPRHNMEEKTKRRQHRKVIYSHRPSNNL